MAPYNISQVSYLYPTIVLERTTDIVMGLGLKLICTHTFTRDYVVVKYTYIDCLALKEAF